MKTYVSWNDYDHAMLMMMSHYLTNGLNHECGAIYGLPRGGLPIAVSLSHKLKLPLLMNYADRKLVTDKKILVVDDIADTGNTLKDFQNKHNIICIIIFFILRTPISFR